MLGSVLSGDLIHLVAFAIGFGIFYMMVNIGGFLGPVLAGVVGSFIGAAGVALHESGDLASASRVGWGVVLARALAAFAKVAAAIVVLGLGGTAWIVS